jgi:hypothetical protein
VSAPPDRTERTRVSGALIGFYISCTAVGICTGIAAMCLFAFRDWTYSRTIAFVNIAVIVVASVAAWWTLRAARQR